MHKVTALTLTLNEEANLPRCLASVAWADERLVVDSFSIDRTVEIAEEAGARVLQNAFLDFASQFNWGIEHAANEWILMLDADEVADPELEESVRTVLAGEPKFEVYNIIRDAFFLDRRMKSSAWSNEPLPRLFRKGSLVYKGLVHPEIDLGGRQTGFLKGKILHYTYRSIEHYFAKMQSYSTLAAKNDFDRGKRVGLPYILFSAGWRFFHNYFFRKEIIDGSYGLLSSSLAAYYTFMKYVKLWGLAKQEENKS